MLQEIRGCFDSKNRIFQRRLSKNYQMNKKTFGKEKKVLQFPQRLGILIHVAETGGGHDRVLSEKKENFFLTRDSVTWYSNKVVAKATERHLTQKKLNKKTIYQLTKSTNHDMMLKLQLATQ